MKFSYFPGCSLHGTSKEYDASTQAVCRELGIELHELPDWNCCGATSAHSLNPLLAVALPARNLKIAGEEGLDLVLPCAACFNRLRVADDLLRNDLSMRQEINELVGFEYKGDIKIIHLLDLTCNILGLDQIKSKVCRPLHGLRLVCYYGCLLVRPADITQFDDPEHPNSLDKLMAAIGAEPMNWSYKTECCGASLSLTRDDIVRSLVGRIVGMAKEAGAAGIVTACPLCHQNLEMRQDGQRFPVFHFTELLGLALDVEGGESWLKKHLVDPLELLGSLNLMSPNF